MCNTLRERENILKESDSQNVQYSYRDGTSFITEGYKEMYNILIGMEILP